MKNRFALFIALVAALAASCTNIKEKSDIMESSNIQPDVTESVITRILSDNPAISDTALLRAGVTQVAQQWRSKFGTPEEFAEFCVSGYAATPEKRKELFNKLSVAFEAIWGGYNKMSVELKKPMHLDGDTLTTPDYILELTTRQVTFQKICTTIE